MRKAFSIDQAVEVRAGEVRADLHNCYDFSALSFEVAGRVLVLAFQRNEYGAKTASPVRVRLKFEGVDYLKLSTDFGSLVGHDLEELGYKPPTDDDLDWLVGEDKAAPEYHLVLRFTGDEYIRVHGESATMLVEPVLKVVTAATPGSSDV